MAPGFSISLESRFLHKIDNIISSEVNNLPSKAMGRELPRLSSAATGLAAGLATTLYYASQVSDEAVQKLNEKTTQDLINQGVVNACVGFSTMMLTEYLTDRLNQHIRQKMGSLWRALDEDTQSGLIKQKRA